MQRAHQHQRRGSGRGFSLIELMVVLVLIGILTALILPEMKGTYEDALLRSTGRTLVDVFNLAYSRAITVNQVHRVRIDRKTGRYQVERAPESDEDGSGFVPVRDLPDSEGVLDPRIAIQIQAPQPDPAGAPERDPRFVSGDDLLFGPREDAIAFYPDGTADAAQVLLRDPSGFRLALRLNPVTARVQVLELERE